MGVFQVFKIVQMDISYVAVVSSMVTSNKVNILAEYFCKWILAFIYPIGYCLDWWQQ